MSRPRAAERAGGARTRHVLLLLLPAVSCRWSAAGAVPQHSCSCCCRPGHAPLLLHACPLLTRFRRVHADSEADCRRAGGAASAVRVRPVCMAAGGAPAAAAAGRQQQCDGVVSARANTGSATAAAVGCCRWPLAAGCCCLPRHALALVYGRPHRALVRLLSRVVRVRVLRLAQQPCTGAAAHVSRQVAGWCVQARRAAACMRWAWCSCSRGSCCFCACMHEPGHAARRAWHTNRLCWRCCRSPLAAARRVTAWSARLPPRWPRWPAVASPPGCLGPAVCCCTRPSCKPACLRAAAASHCS